MRVAIQGVEGSFHDLASHHYFGKSYSPVEYGTFQDVFDDVIAGKVDYGIVAIENSLYGSINQVYDLLLANDLWINGEIYLRIKHCLIGLPGSSIKGIREVYSHPVALAQCKDFLQGGFSHVAQHAHDDTAGSVEDIKKWGDPSKAAIASEEAAKLHGLKILKRSVETHQQNYTRFIVLSRKPVVPTDAGKTSFVITQLWNSSDVRAGSLHRALGCFAKRGINLSKIESRPVIGRAWHYIFYMDFDAGLNDPKAQEALQELDGLGAKVRILGSYTPGVHIN